MRLALPTDPDRLDGREAELELVLLLPLVERDPPLRPLEPMLGLERWLRVWVLEPLRGLPTVPIEPARLFERELALGTRTDGVVVRRVVALPTDPDRLDGREAELELVLLLPLVERDPPLRPLEPMLGLERWLRVWVLEPLRGLPTVPIEPARLFERELTLGTRTDGVVVRRVVVLPAVVGKRGGVRTCGREERAGVRVVLARLPLEPTRDPLLGTKTVAGELGREDGTDVTEDLDRVAVGTRRDCGLDTVGTVRETPLRSVRVAIAGTPVREFWRGA